MVNESSNSEMGNEEKVSKEKGAILKHVLLDFIPWIFRGF